MHFHTFRKWSLRAGGAIIILITLSMIVLYVLINQTVDRIYGGQTRIADYAQFQVDAKPTAITNVSILSPDGTEVLANRTVLLSDGVIMSITQEGNVPDGMFIIDGKGKFLIPGLVDSHIHLQRSPNDLLLYVANGVTQIRSMGGSDADLDLKREIENGRIGPHFYVSSPSMNSSDGFGSVGEGSFPNWIPGPIVIWFVEKLFNIHVSPNADQAADDARSFIRSGRDGIKLYGFLSMESYRAILDVADDLNVPSVGHLPDAMPLSELRTTKLREIAHIEEIVKLLLNEFGSFRSQGGDAFLEFVESRKEEIIADLVANDIAVQSTLWLSESFKEQVYNLESSLADMHLEYANPGIVEGNSALGFGWLPGNNKFQGYAGTTPEEIALDREFWNVREEAHHILLKAMIDGGVTILAGTDSNGWLTIPGFALHDELQSLNRAGMTPAQALNAATAAPSHQINNNAGVIEAGRRADLVLLNENPLVDIENTTSIDTVILNGRVLNRAQLDAMLEVVKTANTASRNFDLRLYQ
jgi:amidohydrolase family protein